MSNSVKKASPGRKQFQVQDLDEPATASDFSPQVISQYTKYLSGFCTYFSGKKVKNGISLEEWKFKYDHIIAKFETNKEIMVHKVLEDKFLTQEQKTKEIESIQLDNAYKLFDRVNQNNNVLKFIDLTCQQHTDALVIVIQKIYDLANHLFAINELGERIICI